VRLVHGVVGGRAHNGKKVPVVIERGPLGQHAVPHPFDSDPSASMCARPADKSERRGTRAAKEKGALRLSMTQVLHMSSRRGSLSHDLKAGVVGRRTLIFSVVGPSIRPGGAGGWRSTTQNYA
jgi:hypothetical protein